MLAHHPDPRGGGGGMLALRSSGPGCRGGAEVRIGAPASYCTRSITDDRTRWDWAVLAEGFTLLELSATGTELTPGMLKRRSRRRMGVARAGRIRTGTRSWRSTPADATGAFAGGGAQPGDRDRGAQWAGGRAGRAGGHCGSGRLSSYPFLPAAMGNWSSGGGIGCGRGNSSRRRSAWRGTGRATVFREKATALRWTVARNPRTSATGHAGDSCQGEGRKVVVSRYTVLPTAKGPAGNERQAVRTPSHEVPCVDGRVEANRAEVGKVRRLVHANIPLDDEEDPVVTPGPQPMAPYAPAKGPGSITATGSITYPPAV